MKGGCEDRNHARTRKTRFLNDRLSSYHHSSFINHHFPFPLCNRPIATRTSAARPATMLVDRMAML